MMDRPRVERVTNGRLPRQVVPLKNPRDALGEGGGGGSTRWRAKYRKLRRTNDPPSLDPLLITLFGSKGRELNLDRRVSFHVCRNILGNLQEEEKRKILSPSCLSACQNRCVDPFDKIEKFKGSKEAKVT